MSIDYHYQIAAIPTVYRGRRYRSRLEARWAAFFDLLGWTHEYEPFDLKGWIPDFLLRGRTRDILVEVKPITCFDEQVAAKMAATIDHNSLGHLLLGVAPSLIKENRLPGIQLGWIVYVDGETGTFSCDCNTAIFKCFADTTGIEIDFAHDIDDRGGCLTDYFSYFYLPHTTSSNRYYRADLLGSFEATHVCDLIMLLWAEASNRAQWQPRGDRP